MRKLLILPIIVASIVFSCRSSDETISTNANTNIAIPESYNPILGKWKLTKRFVDGADDTSNIPTCQLNSTEEFLKDGKQITTSYSPIDCKENVSHNTYKYDITTKKLIINDVEVKDIVIIEGNELKYIDEKTKVTNIFTKQ